MYSSTTPKRFVASGAINGANQQAKVCGILVTALSADATVSVYDEQGTTEAERKFSVHHQPGTSEHYPVKFLCRNGGYVEITGTAEVYVYLA